MAVVKNFRCLHFLPILIIFHVASAMRLEMNPDSFNEILTDQLGIKCIFNASESHSYVQQIVMMQVLMEGENPIAILREGKLHAGPGLRDDMKVQWHLEDDASYSSLKVSIMNPRREDVGNYECLMFYLDQFYVLKSLKASMNLTLEDLDLKAVVSTLARRVSDLKRTVEEQDDVISRQKDTIEGHARQLMEHENNLLEQNNTKDQAVADTVAHLLEQIKMQNYQIAKQDAEAQTMKRVNTNLQDKVSRLEKTMAEQLKTMLRQAGKVSGLETSVKQQIALLTAFQSNREIQTQRLDKQTNHINEHVQKDREIEAKIENLSNDISELNTSVQSQETELSQHRELIRQQKISLNQCKIHNANRSEELQNIVENAKELYSKLSTGSTMSAFSYGYDKKDIFDVGRTMVFSKPILNIGDDYNPENGVFTAPQNGLYVFHLTATTASASWAVEVNLQVNKKTVVSLHSRDGKHWDQSSMSTIVSLQAGDKVKPVVAYKNTGNWIVDNEYYSVFTGYLMREL